AHSRARHRDPVAVVQRRGRRHPRRAGQAGHCRLRRGLGLMATSVTPRLARVTAPAADAPLLRVSGVSVDAGRAEGPVRLVDDISFELARGWTLGLVGESGSGKTVTAMSIIRLLPPALRVAAGRIEFDGRDVVAMAEPQLRALRGDDIGVVFQDPQNS